MQATRSSRLVNASNAIERVFPEAMQKPARLREAEGDAPPTIEYQGPQKSLRVTEKFLHGEVTLNKTKVPRSVLMPPEYLVDLLLIDQEWASKHHPVLETIVQVEGDFGNRLAHSDMDQFRMDLILSTQQTLVVRIYTDFIKRFRKLASFPK
jgi:hypothetical protein